ncbi:phasin family protein [Paenibacillus sp. y28]|uniref:phasin family protein n=1 Tax=Paenibacillus sp. y28 TaxID=3129110 RepID=UPI00301B4BF6
MRELIGRAVALGLGLAVTSKEQVEKTVEELVKKGEVSRQESSSFVDELLRKGEEARARMDATVQERVQSFLEEQHIATKRDVERLEQRIALLEQQLKRQEDAEGRDRTEE